MSNELNINDDIKKQELEAEIKEAEEVIELGEDLKWLMNNQRFQNVIVDGYIGQMAEYLFDELTKPITLQSQPEDRLKEGLLAIRHLKSYIGFDGQKGDIEYNHDRAVDALKDAEDALFKL